MTRYARLAAAIVVVLIALPNMARSQDKQPNIVIIWGDDIGQSNISAYSMGLMGYRTPNIDSIAKAGMIFTDYYAEQSCTAGRASFITGQHGLRCPGTPSVTTLGDRNCYELGGAVNTCETMDAEGRPLLRSRGRRRFARLPGLSGLPGCLPGYLVILSRSCRR